MQLRPRRKPPRNHRAAEKRDELASPSNRPSSVIEHCSDEISVADIEQIIHHVAGLLAAVLIRIPGLKPIDPPAQGLLVQLSKGLGQLGADLVEQQFRQRFPPWVTFRL